MSLPKLPCEDKELQIKKTRDCFEGISKESKERLLKAFEKCANNMEKLRWEEKKFK